MEQYYNKMKIFNKNHCIKRQTMKLKIQTEVVDDNGGGDQVRGTSNGVIV